MNDSPGIRSRTSSATSLQAHHVTRIARMVKRLLIHPAGMYMYMARPTTLIMAPKPSTPIPSTSETCSMREPLSASKAAYTSWPESTMLRNAPTRSRRKRLDAPGRRRLRADRRDARPSPLGRWRQTSQGTTRMWTQLLGPGPSSQGMMSEMCAAEKNVSGEESDGRCRRRCR